MTSGLIGYAITLFVFIIANAIGGIIGGWASDRFGKKPVIVPTLLAAAPFFYLAFSHAGPPGLAADRRSAAA